MGWLQAKPKNWPDSRIAIIQQKGGDPGIPDAGPLSYLLDDLMDAGPTSVTPMGESPLGWRDLSAWAEFNAVRIEPWEARVLRSLSAAYMAARKEGEDVLSVPPVNR